MSLERLFGFNPWWYDAASIGEDHEIRAWKESKMKWDPRREVSFDGGDSVYSLRGPRRVGKTTLLKMEIMGLLEGGAPPNSVMYYAFDLEESPSDVASTVCAYLERVPSPDGVRRFLFLDEISNVRNWQRAIKSLWDRRKLVGCTVVTTGSHMVDLRVSDETLPGRRGRPRDRLDKTLLPMSFGEYVVSMEPALIKIVRGGLLASREGRILALRALAEGQSFDGLDGLSLRQDILDRHLDMYLVSGGMPVAANYIAATGQVSRDTYEMHLDAVQSVMHSAGRDPLQADRVASSIISSLGSPVSWSSLSRDTGMAHRTAEEYVGTLQDMMIAAVMYRYDSGADAPNMGSNKKIYFRDPLFQHVFGSRMNETDPHRNGLAALDDASAKGLLVEQVVADHALRLADAMRPPESRFEPTYSAMYWRSSKSKREVDFVVRDGRSVVPIEVKYQAGVRRSDTWGLIDFEKATGRPGGILVTREHLRAGKISLVPASIFLLLA